MIIWFTGMSGAGKSTLSERLNDLLQKNGYSVCHFDGDVIRKQNKTSQCFTRESILENNCLIIEKCNKLVDQYDFVLVSVISPYEETRKYARKILRGKYYEIYINCSLEMLIKRDTKGFYQKNLQGEMDNLIGVSENFPYETPTSPDLVINTDHMNKEVALLKILEHLQIQV